MKVVRKLERRLRCRWSGHRWQIYLGSEDRETCDRCGETRALPSERLRHAPRS